MITLNGNRYRLCLLDTNTISDMVKRPDPILRNYFGNLDPGKYIPCFSLFTILELRQRDDIYKRFLENLSLLPCIIVKSHEQLFQDELNYYPDPSKINPILLASPGALMPKTLQLADLLNQAFNMPEFLRQEDKWNSEKTSIVEGMLSLVKNYPPNNNKYTPKEIRTFVEMAGFQQIAYRAHDFARSLVESGISDITGAFPSIKMIAFNVFYKFYTDNRRSPKSDTFDILISSALPYMDAVVTEKNQAEVLRKIKKQDKFIENLEVLRLKDIQETET